MQYIYTLEIRPKTTINLHFSQDVFLRTMSPLEPIAIRDQSYCLLYKAATACIGQAWSSWSFMIFYSLSRSLWLDTWICILFILIQLRQRFTPAGVRMPRCCWMWYCLKGWPPCHIWLRADNCCPFVLLFEGYPTNCRNHIRTTQQPEKNRQAPWFPIIVYNRPSILLFFPFL